MPVEIEVARGEEAAEFLKKTQREALSTLYGFPVIWHEQRHEFFARDAGQVIGVACLRIAASLGYVEALSVLPAQRRRGAGRALLQRCEEVSNYYNCHKMTLEVPSGMPAAAFFRACGYHLEATMPQHIFKKDVDIMRKFLL